ncbi:Solute carrier family 43 member 3 [Labeo rohita]|uniref:Solute carrier family 43 member 3 n=1 Tax=Labeo rohita TaxID=84645 RepID=A0ABQ8M2W2_LABRO|nr:Solute carrier family 43 member 3 [Labeo rohita]
MFGCQGSGLRVRSWFTLISGLVECLGFAGAVFGWASLVFVLKTEGYFRSLCVNITINGTAVDDCSRQDEQLSLIFTIASFMNNFLTLPNGFLFDHFGTTVARLLGIEECRKSRETGVRTEGLIPEKAMISQLREGGNFVNSILLFPALSFIAVGGILFLVTNIQVGNLFGMHRSTIITLYNGAFDSSSAVFLIIKLLYEDGVSLKGSFLFLACCSVIHLVRTFVLMPRTHIPYPLPENYTYGVNCGVTRDYAVAKIEEKNIQTSQAEEEMPFEGTSPQGQNTDKMERSFKSCLLSWFFLWHLLWLSVMQLRHYLFIGTLNPMLNHLAAGDPGLVSSYTNAFAFTQLCGILCAPWNGLIMDRHKGKQREPGQSEQEADLKATILSLSLTALQCVLFSVCAATPILPLQFPSVHFGKLFGMVMALSAIVSLLQYPCFTLIKGPLGGDPLYVNIGLTVLSLLAFINPLYVYLHCRRQAAQRASSNKSASS